MSATNEYVLVTPTKNEEKIISITIDSVIQQSIRPKEWVIVSDGSTDRTNQIIRSVAQDYLWITVLELPPSNKRNFGGVVRATETGIRALKRTDYEFLGLLDSDVRIQTDYFEKVLGHFNANPKLGLAGGVVVDVGSDKAQKPRNDKDVPGAVQFYRRSCYESLGGFIAVPEGGWDGLACAQARMNGFETRLLTDLVVDHLKPRNVAEGGELRRKWQLGVRDYAVGYLPAFEAVKCVSRLSSTPFVIGAVAWWLGYCVAVLKRRKRIVPDDLIAHFREEQRRRLREQLVLCPRVRARSGNER